MATTHLPPLAERPDGAAGERLDSWKEIAAYLNRDESTVRRWEREGLPVHRRLHQKRASVFAYKSEVDDWWQGGSRVRATNGATRRHASMVGWIAAGVFALVVSTLWFMPRLREQPARRITQITTLPGWEDSPTWSPDGRTIAYASDSQGRLQIYLQQVGGGEPVRWSDREVEEAQPAWSPDGSRIAFVAKRESADSLRKHISKSLIYGLPLPTHRLSTGKDGDLWIRPVLGGAARRIAEDAYYPAWSPDGNKIAYVAWRQERWGLFIHDVDSGSEARELVDTRSPNRGFLHPAWSPDGRWIAFTGSEWERHRLYVVPTDGGPARAVTEPQVNVMMPSWSADGQWLYFSSNRSGVFNLWRIRFNDGEPGPAEQITVGSGDDLQSRANTTGDELAFTSARAASDIWELDLESGRTVRITAETTLEEVPRPSPDGALLAFVSNRLGGNHLWLLDRRTDSLTRVSSRPVERYAAWSVDGSYLYYWLDAGRLRGGQPSAVWQHEIATGKSRKVYDSSDVVRAGLPANRLLTTTIPPNTVARIQLDFEKRVPLRWAGVEQPSCSPDGKWVAADWGHVIWLIPVDGGPPRQITTGGSDYHPVWSPDSQLVYFTRDHREIYVVPVTGGEPKPVTDFRSATILVDYPAVSGDGKKIFFNRIDKTSDIYLLENARD